MRPLTLLLAACGPATLGLSPDEGSARGGERLTLSGRRLPEEVEVRFAGVEARDPARAGRRALDLTTPPGLAGLVDVVALDRRGRGRPLEGAFLYLPLELDFALAPAHYLPPPPPDALDLIAEDLDEDGLPELVLRDGAGGLALWLPAGGGAFTEGEPPPEGGVAGVTAPRGPAGAALFTCAADARAPALLRWDGRGWTRLDAPAEAGGCRGALALDLDGDGAEEVVELRAEGARLWAVEEGGLTRWPGAVAPDAEGCGALAAPEGLDAACEVQGGQARVRLSGAGVATWSFPLPSLALPDAGFTLALDGPTPTVEVVDALGRTFRHAPEPGAGPRALRTPPVAHWAPSEPGATPTLPLQALRLELMPSSAGDNALDALILELEGGARALIEGFDRWGADAPTAGAPRAAAPLGAPPGLLLAGEGRAELFLLEGEALRPAPGHLPAFACDARAAAALDLEGDGLVELALACADGQDVLLRADASGRRFDDSAASLPVDEARGLDLLAADLDRDGLPELVVANDGGVDRLYHGEGDRLVDWSPRLDLRVGATLAVEAADVDGDADLDLLFLDDDGLRLFVLRGGSP